MSITIKSACEILEIDFLQFSNITTKELKKKYHCMALRHHPDKNYNTVQSNEYFQSINDSYEYLLEIIMNDFNEELKEEKNDYIGILSLFISSIIKSNSSKNIINFLVTIMNGMKDITIFEEFDKETYLEVYQFLCNYKDILYIDNKIILIVKDIILEKFKNDKIYILNPSIDDLFDNNIYKLMIDEKMYLVPLWHNEIYFEGKGHDIIVYCVPLIDNVDIDDNNIYYKLYIDFNKNILEEKYITFMLGKREFMIPTNQLQIKTVQFYTFKNQGISQINENGDMYNTSNKGDIIIKLIFT
jgi:hypothetical protein